MRLEEIYCQALRRDRLNLSFLTRAEKERSNNAMRKGFHLRAALILVLIGFFVLKPTNQASAIETSRVVEANTAFALDPYAQLKTRLGSPSKKPSVEKIVSEDPVIPNFHSLGSINGQTNIFRCA